MMLNMHRIWRFALLGISAAAAQPGYGQPGGYGEPGHDGSAWQLSQFKNLIVFGDSYSDESGLAYFLAHDYKMPPPGTVLPESFKTASGGRIWNRYVVQYTGTTSSNGTWDPQISLFNYAVSGGVCSNDITPRDIIGTDVNFPAIVQYELPGFLEDLNATNPATGKNTFYPGLSSDNTVYVPWVGGNDLGEAAFFTDSQVPGTDIVDYLNCVYGVMDKLYAQGARYFVLPNQPPFDLAPLYANDTEGGIDAQAALNYWPAGKPDNNTAIAAKMHEFIALVNDAFFHRTPYESIIANRYPGAHIASFDIHSLFYNIHQWPDSYLNGTRTPYNTTAYAKGICTVIDGTCSDPDCCDSFMWFDSLHKSEQTDRMIAREFVNVISGNSSHTKYW